MSEPYDVTTAADRACGLRRYVDRTGREWIEPRPGPKKPPRKPYPALPDGFREITIKAFTDGRNVVVPEQEGLWLPDEYDPCHADAHNCDASGCGVEHVLVRFRMPEPTP